MKKNIFKKSTFNLAFTSLLIAYVGNVAAEASTPEEAPKEIALERILVTSEKRVQSLQDAPVAVTAFSDDFIDKAGIDSATDLVGYVPGLQLASFSRVQALPTLRGAQSGEDGPGLDQPVAFFVDDVYKGRVTDWDLALFDVERIEVLRGPQGTLYGRNVVGGLINVVTKKPSEEKRAVAELKIGNYDLIDMKGVFGGALSADDGLYGSFAFSSKKRQGFTTNTFNGKELDSVDKSSAKLQLRYAPGGNFEALLQADFIRDTGFGQHRDYVGPVPDAAKNPDSEIAGFTPDTNPETVNHEQNGGIDRTASGMSLAIDYDFGSTQFKSITALYTDEAVLDKTSAFGLPAQVFYTSQDYELDQFSQEFRLSGSKALDGNLEWVVGAYFLNIDHTRNRRFNGDLLDGSFLGDIQFNNVSGDTAPQFFESLQTVETNSASAFFQGTYSFTDTTRVTIGGRYTNDKKEGKLEHKGNSFLFNDAGEFQIGLPEASFSAFTPRLTFEYDFSEDIMTYVTYSEGFKSGGFTVDGLDEPSFYQTPLNPEKAENYEIGLRSAWFNNRLTANITAYSVTYTDLQVSQLVTTGGQVTFLQTSAGKAEAEGVDVELNAAITADLTGYINYSYFDGEYTDFGDLTGNEMVSPPHAYNIGLNYFVDLAGGHELEFHGDVQHKDEYFQDPANEPGIVKGVDSIVNAGVTWTLPTYDWEFSIWVKNLTDERAVEYANDSSVFILSTEQVESGAQAFAYNYAPPMTWGISVRYTFE